MYAIRSYYAIVGEAPGTDKPGKPVYMRGATTHRNSIGAPTVSAMTRMVWHTVTSATPRCSTLARNNFV